MFLAICFPKKTWKQKNSIFLAIKTTVHFQHVSSQSQLQKNITASLSIFCRRFSRDQPSKKYNLKKQLTFFQFFGHRFSRDQPSKKYNLKKIKLIFFQFFCRRFSRDQPSKKYSFKKKLTFFFVFFCRRFSRDQPSKKYKFKKNRIYIFSVFFAVDFPATSLPKKYKF